MPDESPGQRHLDEVEKATRQDPFRGLVAIMRILRGPDGCPWDREQDLRSLRRYVLEEAYEVVQAIDDADMEVLPGELGDLLLQVVFLSRVAREEGAFDVDDVIEAISDKLVRRHPHVFGDAAVQGAGEVLHRWEMLKLEERGGGSVLDDIPGSLPALARAEKLGRRAAQIGFDWAGPAAVLDKVEEEIEELREAIAGRSPAREGRPAARDRPSPGDRAAEGGRPSPEDRAAGGDRPSQEHRPTRRDSPSQEARPTRRDSPSQEVRPTGGDGRRQADRLGGDEASRDRVEEEIGDLLFALSSLARHLGISPEVALRRAGEKFERRFRAIEPEVGPGGTEDPEAMERLWEEQKAHERRSGSGGGD